MNNRVFRLRFPTNSSAFTFEWILLIYIIVVVVEVKVSSLHNLKISRTFKNKLTEYDGSLIQLCLNLKKHFKSLDTQHNLRL